MNQGGRFHVGDRVRVAHGDGLGHTRAPRYVRGHVGIVADCDGTHALPDVGVATGEIRPEPVYAVRFSAVDLFGSGDHKITLNLWESYLEATQ